MYLNSFYIFILYLFISTVQSELSFTESGQKLKDVFFKKKKKSSFKFYTSSPSIQTSAVKPCTIRHVTQSATRHPTAPQRVESMRFFIFHLSAPSDTGGPLPQRPQSRSVTALLWLSHGRHIY